MDSIKKEVLDLKGSKMTDKYVPTEKEFEEMGFEFDIFDGENWVSFGKGTKNLVRVEYRLHSKQWYFIVHQKGKRFEFEPKNKESIDAILSINE